MPEAKTYAVTRSEALAFIAMLGTPPVSQGALEQARTVAWLFSVERGVPPAFDSLEKAVQWMGGP